MDESSDVNISKFESYYDYKERLIRNRYITIKFFNSKQTLLELGIDSLTKYIVSRQRSLC